MNFKIKRLGRAFVSGGIISIGVFLPLLGNALSSPYKVNCTTPFIANITSEFAEARKSGCNVGSSCIPDRFHAGIDTTGQCVVNADVYAIEAGTIQTANLNACENSSNCVRILGLSGHIFDYVHVVPSMSSGTVSTSTIIGKIQNISGAHLHLNDVIQTGTLTSRINPQFPGRLNYSDPDVPEFDTASIAPVVDEEIIFVDYDADTYPTPFMLKNGKFYVSGRARILATARNGGERKGLYRMGSNAFPIVQFGAISSPPTQNAGNNTQVFGYLQDNAATTQDVQNTYYMRQGHADTYIVTNKFTGPDYPQAEDQWWDTTLISDGLKNICVYAQNHPSPSYTVTQQCASAYVDNTKPTFTMTNPGGTVADRGATSTATITVNATDSGGIYSIAVAGGVGYSSTAYISGVDTSESVQFPGSGTLDDGSYTVTVVDLSGNAANAASFIISTGEPFAEGQDDKNAIIGNVIPSSRCIVIHATDTVSGVASISISGTGLSETMTYSCGVPAKSTDVYAGAFCNLAEYSTYTYTVTSCSGKQKTSPDITITTSTKGGSICATSPAGTFCGGAGAINDTQLRTWGARLRVCMSAISCGICNGGGFESIVTSPAGSPYCGDTCCRVVSWAAPLGNKSFSVTNTTDAAVNSDHGYYRFSIYNPVNGDEGEVSIANLNSPNFKMNQGQSTSGTIDVAQIGQGYPKFSPDGVAKLNVPFARLELSQLDIFGFVLSLAPRLLKASAPYIYGLFGSDAVFNSTTTLTLTYVDTVNTDTATVRIYLFDGVSWSSSGITNQTISYSTTTHVIAAAGSVIRTGLYATLYQAQDSSAPVTTLAFEGASFNFDGALFVSTDAYVVLTATDPAVNGFASTVASVTYRLDPSIDSPFSIYSSSIPLSLGSHVFEYRSLDYAGNVEATKTSTFTVTAGTAFRTTNTARVPGVLLNGFLGSGAKLEIESQAQNSLTLLISSVNRQAMVAVDNIGEVGIGVTPQANLNVGVSSIAVQLRAGNSTSAVTSNQIAFGYNGDYSMRHLLRTEHSTAAHGNKLDFLVWNTGAASTTTLASLNVLSLQGIASAGGGSFHVQPVGEPDAEVEVSNGLSTGGGTMQRLQWVLPSSRRFKTDIKELSAKDEDRALADVAGLKHARFRYKSRGKDGGLVEDPAQPLRTGLIYEDAPDSIRDGKAALSTGERLVNVELALKASIRRLEELQARYERLKARRKP